MNIGKVGGRGRGRGRGMGRGRSRFRQLFSRGVLPSTPLHEKKVRRKKFQKRPWRFNISRDITIYVNHKLGLKVILPRVGEL